MTLAGHLAVTVTDTAAEFTFSVRNIGTKPIDLEFRSGKSVDFVVDANETVWRWSDNRLFTQVVQTQTLMAEDSITETAIWENPPPGDYIVTATLETTDVDLTKQTEFTV